MATFKWATPEAEASALTTELNSLADAAFCTASSAIDNEAGLYENLMVELVLASLSPATGAYVDVWIDYSIDGTNYADAAKALQLSALLCTFQLDTTAATAQRLFIGGLRIDPMKFKLQVRNKAGVSLGASGNTLKYSRYNEQSV
jgi:hypothetical protein